ncbi:hypothetical protein J1N35_041556 [Gossypium stocksii]|uniref:Uncharacterized protein n=1 Tax=Gossypium stocksii TaxID=47602 RepID=A0A9D3UG69_9ROSI|nr:hypothetical protein J1N35_041556 [Gossypium stocksii]
MASTFTAMSSVGSFIAPNSLVMDKKLSSSSNKLSSLASISSSSFLSGRNVILRRSRLPKISVAKELHFNKDGSAIKKLQTGVNKLTDLVRVTLRPKGRNVVLESKYDFPKIINDGVTVAKEVELEDPVENIGANDGNNNEVGNMIAEAMSKVGRKGVVTLEEGKSVENSLYVVEGMQFDRGYISPYVVTGCKQT